MNDPQITVVGNVAGTPTLRTTAAGHAVTDFRIAATPRRKDKATEVWSDGETLWFGVTAWRALAEHCSTSLKKGDRVVVTGRLSTRTWQAENGERRSNLEVDATSVGLDLARSAATSIRPARLVVSEDPWVSDGTVDPTTGEVRMVPVEREEPDLDEDADGDEVGLSAAA